MNIDVTHQVGMAMGCQQPIYQALQAVGLVDDDLGVLGQFAAFKLHLQQLRSTANPAQRVLDLVGQVADQLLVGLGLVQQALLAVLAGLLLQRPQLHQDFADLLRIGHAHMHGHRVLVLALEAGFIPQGREVLAPRARQCGLQQGGVGEEGGEVHPLQGAAREAERVLQRCIGELHGAIGAQHRHQGGHQVQRMKAPRVGGWGFCKG
ncbi:hypothetical protein D3C71_1153340 [compost metagenome]